MELFQAGLWKVLSDPNTAKALKNVQQLKELIHVSSSSHISSTHSGRGFKHLFVQCLTRVGVHKKEKMPSVFDEMLNILESLVPDSLKDEIMQAARSMARLFDTEDKVAHQSIAFQNGNGKVTVITFGYHLLSDSNDRYKWFIVAKQGAFELMPDYMIVRHNKSNFFRTKSRDEIKYISRGVTSADILDLVGCIIALQLESAQLALEQSASNNLLM